MLDPVEVPMVICPPVANTASPSFIAFPLILINPQNSSPAPSQANATDRDLMLDTPVGTVNELLTLAPAKLSNAWKLDVALRPLSDLDITIAMFIFLLYQARSFNGPIAPSILDPPRLDTTSLAAKAPAPILTIWSLLVLNALLKVDNPPLMSPFKNDCDAFPASAASRNARPAPVSIKFTLKERFALLRGALRLGAMFIPCGGVAYGHPDLLICG
jgi:hypothetical protein